ncbi:sigma-54 interaction domain-containing protein [Sporomusa malonica]|uniref:Transcriptional regulator containing PAS, AAA-type ATPase, and DNA-binding Fis domains n=1 Tax=Sporomusa malonica TaxID=112901 RepID=A0A1W1Y5L4_9FIRM|nr:sigma 54-interacting transcriptional regulator [Sporomusa malonica]SMC31427.1 Transcriptional regulator containing PAS, AAA-type ATPase, and DNA-binding Fis domains [Sporomusa malonica]
MAKHSEIMKQVFAHMAGMVVVDQQSRIVFVEETYAASRGFDHQQVIGRYVKDVIPTSKLPVVIESGKPILGDVFYYEGKTVICNRYPLIKDGVIIGAISYQVFEGVDKLFESIQELRTQLDYYKEKIKKYAGVRYSIGDIIGSNPATVAIRTAILKTACTNATVLIQGETGTGKELVAHALHQESRRSPYPFVKLNCAAIPQELIESELFGYDEGAFTGARRAGKKGKFELADKGTLFLDEISQLSMSAQAKLLRVLQEKEIERIGGAEPIPVNVRIVAATNDDLEDMVKQGTFRADLYYRLNVIPIKVAPLRERKSDIPLLVNKFAEKYGEQAGLGTVAVDPDAMALLMEYEWPGNIRELDHAVERAINLCSSTILQPVHFEWLMPKIRNKGKSTAGMSIQDARAASEKEIILNALQATKGNKKKAAELLGIARPLLYQKMHRLGITS